jgi:hypothetical protein
MTFYEHYLKERIESFYHGSPYEFDTFDINKAGSGDGLNKFGYGLYFTDNEELANFYASELIGKGKERGYNIQESINKLMKKFGLNEGTLKFDKKVAEYALNDLEAFK